MNKRTRGHLRLSKTIFVVAIAFTLICSACSGDPVVGIWEVTTTREQVVNLTGEWDGRARIRFDSDGKYSSVGESGTWKRLDGNRLQLNSVPGILRDKPGQKIVTVNIDGKILTITWEDGHKTLGRRVS
jgi:hypothetical protein